MAARKPRRTTAQKLANPNWRASLPDSALSPAQRATRARNKMLAADPLAPVSSNREMGVQAQDIVKSLMQPDEQAATLNDQTANANFATRRGLLTDLGNQRSAQMNDAFTATNNSLNNLIGVGAGVAGEAQGNLVSALRQPSAGDALQQQLGGGAPPADESQLIAQSAQNQAGLNAQMQGDANANIAAAGAMKAVPGIETAQSLGTLSGEFNADAAKRAQVHTDLGNRKQGLLSQTMKDLRDFEVAKRTYGDQHANMLFQQYLSQKELDLKVKDMDFQQWLSSQQLDIQQADSATNRRVAVAGVTGTDPRTGKPTLDTRKFIDQSKIDWANVGINQQQVNATLAQIGADAADNKDKKKAAAAQVRGEAWGKGLQALQGYLTPGKGQAPSSSHTDFPFNPGTPDNPATTGTNEATTQYKRTYVGAYRTLLQAGMTRSDALRMLSQSTYTDWAEKASTDLRQLKRRVKSGGNRGVTTTQQPGGHGAGGYGGGT